MRLALRSLVRGAPEVIVKVTNPASRARSLAAIRASAEYIAREGALELEDQDGERHLGREEIADALAVWERGGAGSPIPREGGYRRESLNVVCTMPADVDRASVARAARAFAAREFGGHDYLIADHADTRHPHAHIIVKVTGRSGRRLAHKKPDLARWRRTFAECLREQGLEASATSRAVRGVGRRGERQALRHMRLRGVEPKVMSSGPGRNPHAARIASTRQVVLDRYRRIALELARGDEADRALAYELTRYVARFVAPDGVRRLERAERAVHERGLAVAGERAR